MSRLGPAAGTFGTALAVGLMAGAAGAASGTVAAYALVAGAGTLAVSQRSALFALALVWELTRMPWQVALACAGTALLARGLERAGSRRRGRVGP